MDSAQYRRNRDTFHLVTPGVVLRGWLTHLRLSRKFRWGPRPCLPAGFSRDQEFVDFVQHRVQDGYGASPLHPAVPVLWAEYSKHSSSLWSFLFRTTKLALFTKDMAHGIADLAKRRICLNSSNNKWHEILTPCSSMFQGSQCLLHLDVIASLA